MRPTTRLLSLALAAAALALAMLPSGAAAHPLGNFTINRYSEIKVSGEDVFVLHVIDMAEIPTFQKQREVKRDGYAQQLADGMTLTVDGRRLPLTAVDDKLQTRDGDGDLKTLRFEVLYEARGRVAAGDLRFKDTNFASSTGWKEVVLSADRGSDVSAPGVPTTSVSKRLTRYPKDRLQSPLDVSSISGRVREVGDSPGEAPVLGAAAPVAENRESGFEALIEREALTWQVMLISLLVAAFWGAAHALTPGHGKSMVAAYLVGTRGRPRDAVVLGVTVTVTHTIGVFALGLITLLLSRYIVPERLYPWLTVVSGLLVVAVGVGVLRTRLRSSRQGGQDAHGHAHAHAHGHSHGGGHSHGPAARGEDEALTTRSLLGIGTAAGLLPCPSALVVLLSAIALHRVAFGMALIAAFSVGLAVMITVVGLVVVSARQRFRSLPVDGTFVRLLPSASALLIVVVGLTITLNALPGVM